MIAAVLVTFIFFAAGAARGALSPVRMTEHGSTVLVWLYSHPEPGTKRSRARVERYFKAKVWYGLRLARVYEPFMCLHSHEGAWDSETGNGYHGGLQFDDGFQATYGLAFMRLWGNAGHWPPLFQMVAAYRAQRVRGYAPWGTRELCGL